MPVEREIELRLSLAVRAALAILAAVAALAVLAVLPGGATEAEAAKKPVSLKNMFNSRYCEILGVSAIPTGGFSVQVFNSVGLGYCPADKWDALDFDAIKTSEGWDFVDDNGPRYWLMDTIIGAKPSNPKNFGEIPMRQVATIELSTLPPPTFTEITIKRRNAWVFNKGRVIYTLTAPSGARYVMQAYTRTEDPTLNPNTLKDLGSNPEAAIPAGWTFKSTKLKRPLSLKAEGSATIIRDGVKSVYQKVK